MNLKPFPSIVLLLLSLFFYPVNASGQSASPSALSRQNEMVLMRSNGTVTVMASLEFVLPDPGPALQELTFEIPAKGAQKVTAHHGYTYMSFCLENGDCNHRSEDVRETRESRSASHGVRYEKLSPVASGNSYKVKLAHPTHPGNVGSFLITYQLPKALKGRNKSLTHEAIKTTYQPRESAVAFGPDTDIVLTKPKNPNYNPLPIKLQELINEQSKDKGPQSIVAHYDLSVKRYNAEKKEDFKHYALQELEQMIKSSAENGQFAQEGLKATAQYSMGGPTFWQRILASFSRKKQKAKEEVEEKKAYSEQQKKNITQLFNSGVPDALDFYRTIYGVYPKSLDALNRTELIPLVTNDKNPYLTNAGFLSYEGTYSAILALYKVDDPLSYELLAEGLDYKLCLKKTASEKESCFSAASRPGSGMQIGPNDDQETKDFFANSDKINRRDAFRETSVNMIGVHLTKYFTKHQKFPGTLAELTPENPQFMRTEVITDPLTKAPHPYKILAGGQDFELCLRGEKLSSGDESLTHRCFNKALVTGR